MEGASRDDTQDWLLPAGSAPPLISELEHRVDEALAIAKASEAAVMTVGAAALDAAEQARRAAELAERAARSAEAAGAARAAPEPEPEPFPVTEAFQVEPEPVVVARPVGDSFESFNRHADRVLARLREIDAEPAAL
jgi:hypothetical protein